MKEIVDLEFDLIPENKDYREQAEKVLEACFLEEGLDKTNLSISVILTTPARIHAMNKMYRNVDKETDVLSFPMFEKEEIEAILVENKQEKDVLGDIVISIERVKEQAVEYGHSFEREFSYMLVHGFYHLMGYDHIEEKDKVKMRPKEENILAKLEIKR